jgi:AcrR family transcriptional regulator
MRSAPDDRTARAIIRDEALRLFAARGPDAVTIRQVAAAAGVSPGLVVHHFGSKEGLRETVDQHVLGTFEAMLAEMTRDDGARLYEPAAAGPLAEAVTAHLPPDSPAPAYLRRLLLDGGEAGRRLFRRIFELSKQTLSALADAGLAWSGQDPDVRAAFLMANDLAVLLLREHLTDVLGADPLTGEGMARWAREVLSIYAAGLLVPPRGERQ